MTLLAPDPARPGSFHDLGDRGDHPAVITSASTVSYAQLDERVTEMAEALGPERRLVAIEAANTIEALVAYLASLRGEHPVLLLPGGGSAHPGHTLVAGYDPDVVIGETTGWVPRPQRTGTAHVLHENLALLLSTSGSTGSPKLVRLSRDNLDANAHAIMGYLDIGPDDRAITTLPMQYCYGLSVMNSHLRAGASLVLTEHSVVDRCFWDLFSHAGATGLAGVPHTFHLLDRAGFDTMSLPTLRRVTQAGGRMSPEMVRRYLELGERRGWDLFVMYGQTEATARMAYLPPALARSHPHTIGVPIPGGSFTIEAPDADGVGELVYHGPNVMLGYAETPGDLALGATVEVLRTGDLARRTPDGLYEIAGRTSRFVKPYGLRVDLDRIEHLVAEIGITAMCTGDDHRLVVAVEHPDHAPVVEDLLAEHLALPRSHVMVLCLDELPRLDNGKPDHAALRQLATAVVAPAPSSSRSSDPVDTRAAIRSAYARILGVDASDDDTFVSLGGDSLSYIEMSIRLEELLGALPRDWHVTRLVDIAPIRRPRRFLAPTDTSIILRATAITLVVGTHAHLWELPGGAHTLFAIAGYNFARFQLHTRSMFASIARIAVPSMCWIAIVAATSDKYGWPNALLINGLVERTGDRWGYWFIEALVQTLILLALLSAVPAVGRLERSHPLVLPLLAVATGLVFRFDVVEFSMSHRNLRPHEAFWLFALGWTAARATDWPHRLLVSALAAVAVPGFYNNNTSRELIILTGILLITWVPTLPVPRVAHRVIGPVAGASLYIYLTHLQVYPPLARLYGPAAAVAGSLLVGIGAWIVARRLIDGAEHAIRRARPPFAPLPPPNLSQ
jgi:acyl-coenzyme A synthetase/AMP-(fatty) acid ligase